MKEMRAVECVNDMKSSTSVKTLRSATKDSRKQKRRIVPVQTRKRYQKSAGESESIVSRKDFAVVPSGTPEIAGGELAEGKSCCPELNVATSREHQQLQTSEKVKLQLFPVNESTRFRLEKDGYNPFLELTLSPKKRIWSVIKHINTKWGNENGMFGEAFLFPYDINLDDLASYRRWSLDDSAISVVEVYRSLNCPAVFRLRYGWFSDHQLEHFSFPLLSAHLHTTKHSDVNIPDLDSEVNQNKESKIENKNLNNVFTTDDAPHVLQQKISSFEPLETVGNQPEIEDTHTKWVPWEDNFTNISIGGLLTEASLLDKIVSHDSKSETKLLPALPNSEYSLGALLSEVSLPGKAQESGLNQPNQPSSPTIPTSLSIGGLLFEASNPGKMNNNINSSTVDSFDAFLASKLNSHPSPLKLTPHESRSSIFDAEDTCHAFPARKASLPSSAQEAQNKSGMKILPQSQEDTSSHGLKGIKWNDSLGPFDLGQPICLTLTVGDSRSASQLVK